MIPLDEPRSRRADDTLGLQVGRVTRVSGQSCWYSVDAGFERGPARIPQEITLAVTVTGSGSSTSVTARPLLAGQTVVVHATRTAQYVLARY